MTTPPCHVEDGVVVAWAEDDPAGFCRLELYEPVGIIAILGSCRSVAGADSSGRSSAERSSELLRRDAALSVFPQRLSRRTTDASSATSRVSRHGHRARTS